MLDGCEHQLYELAQRLKSSCSKNPFKSKFLIFKLIFIAGLPAGVIKSMSDNVEVARRHRLKQVTFNKNLVSVGQKEKKMDEIIFYTNFMGNR
jgi:hypothetical protein